MLRMKVSYLVVVASFRFRSGQIVHVAVEVDSDQEGVNDVLD